MKFREQLLVILGALMAFDIMRDDEDFYCHANHYVQKEFSELYDQIQNITNPILIHWANGISQSELYTFLEKLDKADEEEFCILWDTNIEEVKRLTLDRVRDIQARQTA